MRFKLMTTDLEGQGTTSCATEMSKMSEFICVVYIKSHIYLKSLNKKSMKSALVVS